MKANEYLVSGVGQIAEYGTNVDGYSIKSYSYDYDTGTEYEVAEYHYSETSTRVDSSVCEDSIPAADTGEDLFSWILPVAAVGASVYIAVTEGPKLLTFLKKKVNKGGTGKLTEPSVSTTKEES